LDKILELKDWSLAQLDNYATQIKNKYNIKVEIHCQFGNVSDTINDIIPKSKIDLVVIGAHGSSGFKNFFIGSDAMSAVKHSICPVLVIPEHSAKTTFSEILYPVRFVEGVVQKYDYIVPNIEKNDSNVHLLGIADADTFIEMENELKKISDVILNKKRILSFEKISTSSIAEQVLEVAEKRGSDLLLINLTLYTNWKKFISGNYTLQIIIHAKIPVFRIKLGLYWLKAILYCKYQSIVFYKIYFF